MGTLQLMKRAAEAKVLQNQILSDFKEVIDRNSHPKVQAILLAMIRRVRILWVI